MSVWVARQVISQLFYLHLVIFFTNLMPNGKLYLKAAPGVEYGSDGWWAALPINILMSLVYGCGFLAQLVFQYIYEKVLTRLPGQRPRGLHKDRQV